MTSWRPIARTLVVLSAADAAGGALLAAGLAFHTLFALLPALLLLTGILGFLIDDPAQRAALVEQIVANVPPLAEIAGASLDSVVSGRGIFAVVGLLGLLWGASNFYGSLDEALRRLFPGGTTRGFVERRVRGAIAILIVIGVIVGTIALRSVLALFSTALAEIGLIRFAVPLVTIAIFTLLVWITYRLVPTAPPSWRAAFLPAVFAGVLIGLLTSLFTLIAPLLVGGLRAFGSFLAIFAALIWLNYLYQFLLWGGAWACLRRDDALREDGRQPRTEPHA